MTSQKLYESLKFIDALDRKLELQPKLEAVKSSLANLVSQPAQPQFQSALELRSPHSRMRRNSWANR